MMRKFVRIVLLASLLHLMPSSVSAGEGEFFYGLAAKSGNLWISPFNIIAISKDLSYDWISVKDDQGKIDINDGSPFGFKARDLFRSFGIGFTFGYQPMFSPLGVYATVGYDFRQFQMQPDRSIDGYEKYKPSSFNAGVGVRLAPLLLFNDDDEPRISPFIEVGTRYNKVFSCKAPYDNDISQFNSGFITKLAIGIRNTEIDYRDEDYMMSFFLYYEMPNYNYFDKDFTLDNGSKPYQHIDAKMHRIGFGITMEF